MKLLILPALALLPALPTSSRPSVEGDGSWPQWRGPNGNGSTAETDWTPKGSGELWRMEIGLGYSSVAVHAGKLYTMGHDAEAGLDLVWCLDAVTGDEVWVHTFESKIWDEFHTGGTLATPSIDTFTDEPVVYIKNREGSTFCLDAETGDVVWERRLQDEMEIEYPQWGLSASPLVLADQVLLNVGPILAVDKATGETRWTSKDYGHAYATPAAFERGGKELLAVFNGDGLAVIDRADGSEVMGTFEWETQYQVNASTPIVIDDAIFISSGYNHGGALVAMTNEGLVPVWETRDMKTQMSGAVRIGEHLYGFDDAVLKCFSLDGEELWAERGLGKGALLGSPDRLVVLSASGELIVAKASPAGYEELAREAVIDDGGVFWTRPVLVDGRIYCRSSKGTLVSRNHRAER